MYFFCDEEIADEQFEVFKRWYLKENPSFKGEIRRSAESLFIAEIVDEKQNMKRFRFMRGE